MVLSTKPTKKLRFLKIMAGKDYTKLLFLPPMIANEVNHLVGQETELEDKRGNRWPVTVSKVDDALAFEKGWQKFYSDHRLKHGEFLEFKYIWGSHFVVRIYGLSACDRENFDEMPRQKKKAITDPGPAVEKEPFQTFNINSWDKPVSDTPDASQVERNIVPTEMEALDCMMKKEDGCYQEEDRTILGDLSIFEQDILLLPDPNKSRNVSSSHIGFSKHVRETIGDDDVIEGHSDESLTDKLEKPLRTKLVPRHSDIVDEAEKSGYNAEIDVIQTKGHSGNIVTNMFKKAVETKTKPFHHEIVKQAMGKKPSVNIQTTVIHSSQSAAKYFKKPSEKCNFKGGMFDVSSVQNGSSKKRQRLDEAKSSFYVFSDYNSVAKDPPGKNAVKSKMMEMEGEASRFPRASRGKEPIMVDNDGQMKVKDEPQSYDDIYSPPAAFTPFSVEVKSKLYLELPEELRSFRDRGRPSGRSGKAVYVRDSKERLWPLFYPAKFGVKALCLNWTNFCHQNNVNPGDKCKFQLQNDTPCIILRLHVIRSKSGGQVPRK